MKQIISLFFGLIILSPSISAQSRPNFVLFIADDCTYWDLATYGSKDSKTPNIDQLASEGMKFNKCYQAAPMCSPTRHNLLTGRYPVKTGAYPNHTFVQKGTQSIVQMMRPHGYRMAFAGKRHIGPREVFDFEYLDKGGELDLQVVDEFLDSAKGSDDPFCLFLCSRQPHGPWDKGNPENFDPQTLTLPPNLVDTKETREAYSRYLAEIEYMDGQVGQAMELLRKHGLDEETVLVFTSEQGSAFPFAKFTTYNAGLHTGFIVRWPGVIQSGSTSCVVTDYTDVVPTFLDIAGISAPKYLDGQSIKKVLTGQKSAHKKYSFGEQTTRGITDGSEHYGIRSVSDGRYRYILNLTPNVPFSNGVTQSTSEWWVSWLRKSITDDDARDLIYKFLYRPAIELYDDLKDPYNQNNLIDQPGFEKVSNKLALILKDWMEECGDKGNQTEMEAFNHIVEWRKKQKELINLSR